MNVAPRLNPRLVFYGLWLLLGLLQAGLTELQDDEAYYWVYSRFLDWGYFDHPPMTGLLVKLGYAVFPNELGVRLLPLLLNISAVAIMEKLTSRKNPPLFYAIALSLAVLQLSGFMAVPDNPLIFFTALFFYCYQRFRSRTTWINSIWLGLAAALLFYSKYHAVLIVLFTFLSDRKLFTHLKTYLAGVVALVLFLPHLIWEYQHDWVSFRYHLFESNVNAYRFSFTTNYLLGQLLLAGPVVGFLLLPAAWFYKTRNPAEKAMSWTMKGIFIFFLLSSFRGQVEANWTSPAIVSLVVLSHNFLDQHQGWNKLLIRLLPVSIVLILVARLAMVVDFVPIKAVRQKYHSWKNWPDTLRERTRGSAVVFRNSYQRASKYWFYSGQMTFSQNFYRERKNNYNFWPIEEQLLGKPVYHLDIYDMHLFTDSISTPLGKVGYRYDSSFASFSKIRFIPVGGNFSVAEGSPVMMDCRFDVPPVYLRFIREYPSLLDTVRIGVFNKKGWVKDYFPALRLRDITPGGTTQFRFGEDLPSGSYYIRFAINHAWGIPTQ